MKRLRKGGITSKNCASPPIHRLTAIRCTQSPATEAVASGALLAWLNRLWVSPSKPPTSRASQYRRGRRSAAHNTPPRINHRTNRASQSCPKRVPVMTGPSAGLDSAATRPTLAAIDTCKSNSRPVVRPRASHPTPISRRMRRSMTGSPMGKAGCHTNSRKPTLPTARARLSTFSQRTSALSGGIGSLTATVPAAATSAAPMVNAIVPWVRCPSAEEMTRQATVNTPSGRSPGRSTSSLPSAPATSAGGVSSTVRCASRREAWLKAGSSGSEK